MLVRAHLSRSSLETLGRVDRDKRVLDYLKDVEAEPVHNGSRQSDIASRSDDRQQETRQKCDLPVDSNSAQKDRDRGIKKAKRQSLDNERDKREPCC